jgi:hypothetical protein
LSKLNPFFVTLAYINQLTKRTSMTDNEAFEKLKNGDRDAMEWVFRNKRDPFVGYFIKQYKLSVQEATDLAIDALVALATSAENNSEKTLTAQFNTLWIAIGRNIYLGDLKKSGRLPIVNWSDFVDFVKYTEGSDNPFETDDFEAVLPLVEPHVEAMSNPCHYILKQFYWEHKKDKEIADITPIADIIKKMSEAAVKMKRTRCIDTLRKLIFNHLK